MEVSKSTQELLTSIFLCTFAPMNRVITVLCILVSTIFSSVGVNKEDSYGVVRGFDAGEKDIYLIFSADSLFEGSDTILNVLDKHNIHASFFLTGNCMRLDEHQATIRRIITRGDYVGGHSDKHLLYADWNAERTSLVTPDSLQRDLRANYHELAKLGINAADAPYLLPPYEWYAAQHATAIREMGITPINFSLGLSTSNDYTTPDMSNYASSEKLIRQLFKFEQTHTLNGAIILIHPGTSPLRTDKLYNHLDYIITHLRGLGYTFKRL